MNEWVISSPPFTVSNIEPGDFDKYTTAAILDTGIITRAVDYAQLKQRLFRFSLLSCWSLAPSWLPLVAEATARRILSDNCADSAYDCADGSLRQLALKVLHVQGKTATPEAVATYTRELVTLYLFSGINPARTRIFFGYSDTEWGYFTDAAIWLKDAALLRRILSEGGLILPEDFWRMHRSLDLAAARGPRMLHTIRSVNPRIFSDGQVLVTLLTRACMVGDESVFHFAMDGVGETSNLQDPDVSNLWSITKRCPSVSCYRRLTKFLGSSLDQRFWPRGYRRVFAAFRVITGGTPCCLVPTLRGDRDGAQRLCFAARRGNLEMVRYFVDGDALRDNPEAHWPRWDPAQRDRILTSALSNAVTRSHVGTASFLLARGAPLTKNLLSGAVRTGNTAMVRLLVERGADVNAGTPPPLALAVFHEDMEMFRYLQNQGATLHGEGYRAGGWAMTFARHFGLGSMREELARRGVAGDAQICWVLDREEMVLCPIRRRDYDNSLGVTFEPPYLFSEWFERSGEWHWARMFEIKDIPRLRRLCDRGWIGEPPASRWVDPPWEWPED